MRHQQRQAVQVAAAMVAVLAMALQGCGPAKGDSSSLTMKALFTKLEPVAEVQARFQYEGKEAHETWHLQLARCLDGCSIQKLSLTPEGGAGILAEESKERRVEIWVGRGLQKGDPDGKFTDVSLAMEIVKVAGQNRITKVCWIKEMYQPPTPMWMADAVDIPFFDDGQRPKTLQWSVVVEDRSLFPSTGDVTLDITMQR